VAQDVLRIVLAAETARRVESPQFQRRQSIKAALLAEPPSTLISSLRQAIHDTQLDRVARHSRTVRERLVPVGFEPRPELGIDVDEAVRIVITLALTSAGGYVFDRSAGVDAVTGTYRIRREDDPDRTDEWTAPGLAAWAYFDLMFQEIGGRPQT
jgi:hypothetical protein